MSTEPMFTAAMYGSAEAAREAEVKWLRAENQALRADAERYRWLRNEAWGCGNNRGPHLVQFKTGYTPSHFTELAEAAADAAIDAARAAREG